MSSFIYIYICIYISFFYILLLVVFKVQIAGVQNASLNIMLGAPWDLGVGSLRRQLRRSVGLSVGSQTDRLL